MSAAPASCDKRRCSACRECLDLTEENFYRDDSHPTGFYRNCKPCHRKVAAKSRRRGLTVVGEIPDVAEVLRAFAFGRMSQDEVRETARTLLREVQAYARRA